VKVDLQFEPAVPPEFLYHGTVKDHKDPIRTNGLKGMKRLHVHLSKETETAIKVGSRRGKPLVLKIHAGAMHQDGFIFYLSRNGVWLSEMVPSKYILFDI
jgi:putative RNA 2'-phosphotransferase